MRHLVEDAAQRPDVRRAAELVQARDVARARVGDRLGRHVVERADGGVALDVGRVRVLLLGDAEVDELELALHLVRVRIYSD